MAVNTEAIGKEWPATTYEVGLEKVREYANAVGAANVVHRDREAAKEAGYRDVVAPPMFAVVYCAEPFGRGMLDPEVGINFAKLVHGSQEFSWDEPVCVGDVITTTCRCSEIYEKSGIEFYVYETTASNQDGREVSRGTWTVIVRGE